MVRIARVVAPGVAHHITQRGNRRQRTFFCDEDYRAYLALMSEWCKRCRVAVLAYCLMPNHVHLIAVPKSADDLRRAIGEAHRRYTRRLNSRKRWRGCLWQGRFASYPMDEGHLLTAVRYVEMNPVKARLVEKPGDYRWSSAAAHIKGRDDKLVKVAPLIKRVGGWRKFLAEPLTTEQVREMQRYERTGRALGSERFVKRLENKLGRRLRRRQPGPKRTEEG